MGYFHAQIHEKNTPYGVFFHAGKALRAFTHEKNTPYGGIFEEKNTPYERYFRLKMMMI